MNKEIFSSRYIRFLCESRDCEAYFPRKQAPLVLFSLLCIEASHYQRQGLERSLDASDDELHPNGEKKKNERCGGGREPGVREPHADQGG